MIVHARDVLNRQRVPARVADAVRGAAGLDGVDAVRRRPDIQAAVTVPGDAGDGVVLGIAHVIQAAVDLPGRNGGTVNLDAVGPAGLQTYLKTVAVARQLDLAAGRRLDAQVAETARRIIIRTDFLQQQFVGAFAVSPGADGDVIFPISTCSKKHAAVESDTAVIIVGGRKQVISNTIDTEQFRIFQGPGAGRGALQVDAVGVAGLQPHPDPVHIPAGLQLARY